MWIEATYDVNTHELRQSFEQADDGSAWTYRLSFRGADSSLIGSLPKMFSSTAEVRVLLPTDVAMEPDLHVAEGGSRVDLGGLWLTSADLMLERGGRQVAVSRPLHTPMEQLRIRTAMGGFQIGPLGDASPRSLVIDCSRGGSQIDLSGAWVRDAGIRVDARMGGSTLQLPRGVRIVGLEGHGSSVGFRETRRSPSPR